MVSSILLFWRTGSTQAGVEAATDSSIPIASGRVAFKCHRCTVYLYHRPTQQSSYVPGCAADLGFTSTNHRPGEKQTILTVYAPNLFYVKSEYGTFEVHEFVTRYHACIILNKIFKAINR
jgi:hypothetical protein